MRGCIFCDIANGKEASKKIYEDSKVVCILDVKPIAKGHCLVIPKKHFTDIYDIDEDYLKEVCKGAKKISVLLKKKLDAKGVNLLHASGKVAQQSVFHFHIHLVPRYLNDKLDAWPKSKYEEKSSEIIYRKLTRC